MPQPNPSSPQNQNEYGKEEFTITYNLLPGSVPTVVWQGKLRLEAEDELPISELLDRVIDEAYNYNRVILDLRHMSFMNSRGISVLFKFAISLRKKNVSLEVLAVKNSVWQQAHLNNISKLSPDSIITWLDVTD